MGWHLAPYATAISITVIILAFYFSTLISHFHKMGNLQQGEVKAAGKGGGGGGGRIMPTAQDYKSHQVTQGIVPKSAVGGLYHRCYLKEFMQRWDRVFCLPGLPSSRALSRCTIWGVPTSVCSPWTALGSGSFGPRYSTIDHLEKICTSSRQTRSS